ncbi:Alpha/Beta hydrolase protein [Coprinopsis sp. MPI-PUGE-AT-0042]|nr:Alpha/Beta hydrolase protein [Coprinopsis sp. MPI-PUGE-AT-0042]
MMTRSKAQVDFRSPGVKVPEGATVHADFVKAYASIAQGVVGIVASQLRANPKYTIVTSGHGLGGALATLAGISLRENFPYVPIRIYSYGAPRIGNSVFASWVDRRVGVENMFRIVHTMDDIPEYLPAGAGFEHHATKYWQFKDPASPTTVKRCLGDKHPTCPKPLSSGTRHRAHMRYFGIPVGMAFCTD